MSLRDKQEGEVEGLDDDGEGGGLSLTSGFWLGQVGGRRCWSEKGARQGEQPVGVGLKGMCFRSGSEMTQPFNLSAASSSTKALSLGLLLLGHLCKRKEGRCDCWPYSGY